MRLGRYIYYKKLFPEVSDFLNMGLGIEARAKRLNRYWSKHLELTKKFQREHMGFQRRDHSVAVLGAGRLLDVDLEFLGQHCSNIDLYDADPSVLPFWKRLARKYPKVAFGFYSIDLTGTLAEWTGALRGALATGVGAQRLLEMINGLRAHPNTALPAMYDYIVSTNILSQIPIYWFDRVAAIIRNSPLSDYEKDLSFKEELQEGLHNCAAELQQHHLALLAHSQAHQVVIISDVEFYYYLAEKSEWQVENALYVSKLNLPGYTILTMQSWLWHIAPQMVEQRSHGEIHKVVALALAREELLSSGFPS